MRITKKSFLVSAFIFVFLTGLYFFSRLFLLKNLPLFVDEVIYIHWAQLGFTNASLRFASLGDGKQPLFIWFMILVMHVIHNPVIAGRATAILCGFGTAIGLILLTYELFKNKWVALISMLLYILCPFALIMNRLAIYDSLVTMLAMWSLYLGILLVKKINLGNALLLAFFLGAGILNKSSGFLSIYLLPLTLFLFETGRNSLKRFGLWIFYTILSITIALVYYAVLQLSSDFPNISIKNGLFLNSPMTLFTTNFLPTFIHNSVLFSQWIFLLFTPFFLVLTVIGFTRGVKKEKLLLLSMFAIEIVGFALLGKSIAPRYIFFMTMFLTPLASLGLWYIYEYLHKKMLQLVLVVIICFSFAVYSDFKILTDLEYAPVPDATKAELVTGWSAGGGIGDIVKYLLVQSEKQKILVITDGIYGSLSTGAMDVYFLNNQAVDRMAFNTFSSTPPHEVVEKLNEEPVYVFLNQLQTSPHWKMNLISRFEKGHGPNYASLYRLVPYD